MAYGTWRSFSWFKKKIDYFFFNSKNNTVQISGQQTIIVVLQISIIMWKRCMIHGTQFHSFVKSLW